MHIIILLKKARNINKETRTQRTKQANTKQKHKETLKLFTPKQRTTLTNKRSKRERETNKEIITNTNKNKTETKVGT